MIFKKLLLASFLVTQGAFAHTVLIKKHVTSGLVPPELSFVKNCTIYKEGFARIAKKMGSGHFRIHYHHVSDYRVHQIQAALNAAHLGLIKTVGASWDGGDNILDKYYLRSKVILDKNRDCVELVSKALA